jgi:streptogramin lyase
VETLEDRCLLSGGITEFTFSPAAGDPTGLTAGPDGNVWFAQEFVSTLGSSSEFIGRATPDGTVTEFPIPYHRVSNLVRITAGPDGNLWYTGGDIIGRMTTSGIATEFTLGGVAIAITAGPDGNVWFTEQGFTGGTSAIGRITPTGQITLFTLPTNYIQPLSIIAGPDGNLWFTEKGDYGVPVNKIGRITPSGAITEFTLPDADGAPYSIARGPDGNLWFTASNNTIGRITPSGQITEFAIPGASPVGAVDITAGPDGNLYFTYRGLPGDKIFRMSTTAEFSEFTIPTGSPIGIAAGPDGNIWFGELLHFETSGPVRVNAPPVPSRIGKFIISVSGTPNQRYVSQLYLDLLQRPVDPIGLAVWVPMLDHDAGHFQIVEGIMNSPEYRDKIVQNLYNRLLLRDAAPVELDLWRNYFNLGGTAERVEAFILGSDEYLSNPTPRDFLFGVYYTVFDREVDAVGLQEWSQALAEGVSRSDVALDILRSPEANQNEVVDLFGSLLHRLPDQVGFNYFTTALQNGLTTEMAIMLIASSNEYLADLGIPAAG